LASLGVARSELVAVSLHDQYLHRVVSSSCRMIALLKVNCQLAVCVRNTGLVIMSNVLKKPTDKMPDL
jgi:hypothetical protein